MPKQVEAEEEFNPSALPERSAEPVYESQSSSARSSEADSIARSLQPPSQLAQHLAAADKEDHDEKLEGKVSGRSTQGKPASSTTPDFEGFGKGLSPGGSQYHMDLPLPAAVELEPTLAAHAEQNALHKGTVPGQALSQQDSEVPSARSTVSSAIDPDGSAAVCKIEQLDSASGLPVEEAITPFAFSGDTSSEDKDLATALPTEQNSPALAIPSSNQTDSPAKPSSHGGSASESAYEAVLPEVGNREHSPAIGATATSNSFEPQTADSSAVMPQAAELWMPEETTLENKPAAVDSHLSSPSISVTPQEAARTETDRSADESSDLPSPGRSNEGAASLLDGASLMELAQFAEPEPDHDTVTTELKLAAESAEGRRPEMLHDGDGETDPALEDKAAFKQLKESQAADSSKEPPSDKVLEENKTSQQSGNPGSLKRTSEEAMGQEQGDAEAKASHPARFRINFFFQWRHT